MNIDQVRKYSSELYAIARKFGIGRIYVFGSIARGTTSEKSDVEFLIEMEEGSSRFGVAGFMYESEKLLGIHVDVVPLSLLPRVKDKIFVQNLKKEALPL